MSIFKVVPLYVRQLQDVNEDDILEGGLYRKCNVYKVGDGYDLFPDICERRLGVRHEAQFVVHLYGCPLRCSYCYVTAGSVLGEYVRITSDELLTAFDRSGQDVFHLMGGAPALYLNSWVDILAGLRRDKVFHSNFLLVERPYEIDTLKSICASNSIFAVNIKGTDSEFQDNTGVWFDKELFWFNLSQIVSSGISFYMTFTGLSDESITKFKSECNNRGFPNSIFDDSFTIVR